VTLHRDRPTVIANFVSTLDGVVAFDADGRSGGGEVSGFSEPDRFVMGMLRAMADVVLVGAGTVRAAPTHEWTPRHVHRASAELYQTWRRQMGVQSGQPTTIVATATGSLDPKHPGLSALDVPVVVATTQAGAERLKAVGPASNVRIEIAGAGPVITPAELVELAGSVGARLILCEGGPHLIGELLKENLLDELFLTVAPQVAGRDATAHRLALVEGAAFDAATAPWAELGSVRRSGDHLFLRYRMTVPHPDRRIDGEVHLFGRLGCPDPMARICPSPGSARP
jgi:riboflavin biosynthesis pyrimidine reductase